MNLREILSGSVSLLKSQPKAFIPRLVMSVLYTAITLYLVGLTAEFMQVMDSAAVSSFIWRIAVLFIWLPILYFLDILSYAMYPRMVKDHRMGRKMSLSAALKDALHSWRVIMALGLTIFAFLILLVTVAAPLQYLSYSTGNVSYTVLAALLALVLVLAFSVLVFFVVPASIIEGMGVRDSFAASFKLGLLHIKNLLGLNLMFTFMVAVTILFAFWTELEDRLTLLGVASLLAVRCAQTIVYTYVSVANPLAYLSVRVKKAAPE